MVDTHQKKYSLLKIVLIITVFSHVLLSVISSFSYSGKTPYFILFSLVYGAFLFSIYISKNRPTLMFLGCMLYLGFFLKMTFHLILSTPFVEPTGYFRGTPAEWDKLLIVASFGGIGYLLAVMVVHYFRGKKDDSNCIERRSFSSSFNFDLFFKILILAFLVLGALFFAINFYFGINISGIPPKTILPWPLNTVISWFLGIGFGIAATVLMQWEINRTGKLKWSFFALIFEAFLFSLSTLSRALFLFHTLPILYLIFKNRQIIKYSIMDVVKAFLLVACLFILNFSAVSLARSYVYSAQITSSNASFKTYFENSGKSALNNIVIAQFTRMIVDRWIGVEGVMAVIGYQEKSLPLMFKSLFYKPYPGEQDIYSKMCNAVYETTSKYVVTSIPGPVAFFYYSEMLGVVTLGVFLLIILFYFLEILVQHYFKNAFLTCFMSFLFANHIAQFGIFPRQLFLFYVMTSLALFGLFYIERLVTSKLGS